MRPNTLNTKLSTAAFAVIFLLFGAYAAIAQQQVNMTAGPAALTLPDGSSVPMWGYSCGPVVAGSTASCAKLNPKATGWSPVVITVPTGQNLQINLTNALTFGATGVPTSLTIVGQIGGGLGDVTQRTTTTPPDHSGAQSQSTWPIVGAQTVPGTPPTQAPRVQSFSTEVLSGATKTLTWNAPRPGTYLLESGTHPSIQGPMGLYGMVVVTTAPAGNTAGTAYPGVSYNADVPLLLSEIDPVQNNKVNSAVNTPGFSETMVWSGQPGGCGYPGSPTYNHCYPPAVDYAPIDYLINGVSFDKTGANIANSYFGATPAGATGKVLVRFVNAGLRMHVPTIIGSLTPSPVVSGFSLIAEDGNVLPGVPRVRSEVFLAAGKTYDVMISAPSATAALPVFDRQLSLSTNNQRDGGMQGYIGGANLAAAGVSLTIAGTNGGTFNATNGLTTPLTVVANGDTYTSVILGQTLTVSDPSKGVIANDINVYGVKPTTAGCSVGLPCATGKGSFTLYDDGTFTYTPNTGWTGPDTFTYQANGNGPTATVTLNAAPLESALGITCSPITYTSNVATSLSIKSPGILTVCKDAKGYPLTVALSAGNAPAPSSGLTLSVDKSGAFNASVGSAGTYTFTFKAQNSQGVLGSTPATATLVFPAANGPHVTLMDGMTKAPLPGSPQDYRWIIEEDRTFYVDPNCTKNPLPAGCPTVTPQGSPALFGANFHTSYMPVVATGCTGPRSCESTQTMIDPAGTGTHIPAVCDVGNGVCRPDTTGNGLKPTDPSQVHLDPKKRYYISVLPGDAADPFNTANVGQAATPGCGTGNNAPCPLPGHTMGGAPINPGQSTVMVIVEPTPLQTARLSVFVFEDDFPLNGEHDTGGGVDVLSPNEPGLGGFEITLADDAGQTGDATGQPTYDMFNMPLSNALAGTIDPVTGLDACPISKKVTDNAQTGDGSQQGITGMIVSCPAYESDGKTLSPLAGQVIVANLYPGRYGVIATPGADRIARGEEWLQTNTLDGQKAHDSFMRVGEAGYFQEFGPAGYHVSIGFANPAIINARKPNICAATTAAVPSNPCTHNVTGLVTDARMSRSPDERLYGSGSRASLAFTQCYVSLGDPDGGDFAFTKCNADGSFTLTGIPSGDWKVVVFDQWNDQIVDGIATPIRVGATDFNMGEVAVNQWQSNILTRTFFDKNGNGIPDKDAQGNDLEPGLALVPTNIRFRDGSFSNFNNTDLNGYANYNEVFPLFSWYVVETDSTRYKNTGTHVVYDAGGPADGTAACTVAGSPGCGTSSAYQNMANTAETYSVPTTLRVPGAVYCAGADCVGHSIASGPATSDPPSPCTTTNGVTTCTPTLSTGRIDPPWVTSYGWQGFSGQNNFLEFGKAPFAPATATTPAENGGISGHVVYASTRPFDDPQLLLQAKWEPLVPGVTINLYQEGTDSVTGAQTLNLVDSTQTSSWDDWAQGFRSDGIPNMNCPGQSTTDLFYYSLFNQPNYLNWYNSQHGGPAVTPLPNNAQFKCYDAMHNWNQLQPAPYDGMYKFPSIAGRNPTTGKPTGGTGPVTGSNCAICVANPTDGTPMLPSGKYVVEVVVPPGYELVKEEDKNILIGDNFIAPVAQEFAGLSNIFILPDQAAVGAAYNANNPQNPTRSLGTTATGGIDATKTEEQSWPCVGQSRIVPDYISLFPGSKEVAPFAGATRNLCDRKEVMLNDEASVLAKFYIFTSTHASSHYTGLITDDFTSEFDPYSPQFGEKFAPAYLPVSVKDFAGNEISRVYSDQFGAYNGLNYSTWEVNPPNPTGYAPTMMVVCMNDAGPASNPDPLFQQAYSQFCYELPFMPGQTGYFDTPVVPTSAFSEGFNHPDCNYPDATPAISYVQTTDGVGPWVSASGTGHTLTIHSIGNKVVDNYGYSGPAISTAPAPAGFPWATQKVTRHYGFGAAQGTGKVTIGGINAPVVSWADDIITVTVPSGVAACPVQQQQQYGGPGSTGVTTANCGELVITAGNGKQSVDTVTVTIGGKAPTLLAANQTIQSAIDAAKPGDMIMIPAGSYNEMLLMWKPVRLQGVGAVSSVIDANTQPAGKLLDPWRLRVVCLFGLGVNGVPSTWDASCRSGLNYFTGTSLDPQVDRLPLEATVGWDASQNGNLAEQLLEPTLLGAYEGAAITVLSKGVDFHGANPWTAVAEAGAFPDATTLLTNSSQDCGSGNGTGNNSNPHPSNFQCNPSSIDGLGVTNSSQGGGGILVHGWGHNIQIANNRIYNNNGTLSGGITVGQGEHPGAYLGGAGAANAAPGSCQTSNVANRQLPYCFDLNVNMHHNNISLNSSTGDELFSSTPAGAGGVSICNGSDYYKFNYNWICGNMSSGDGGGVVQLGFVDHKTAIDDPNRGIQHNTILFNQSTNPTIPTNGGGLLILSAPDTDPTCTTVPDKDCAPGLGDGTGHNLLINANLILGNSAESGSGGGIRFQGVNGTEIASFPRTPSEWYSVDVTNNIINNNVAGWDGAGVSLQDSLAVNFINNTVVSNDTTASSGILFNTLFAPLASSQGTSCTQNNNSQSCPEVAGLVSVPNSAGLTGSFPATITCPAGHYAGNTANNGTCRSISYPLLYNDVLWQNRSFFIGVGSLGTGTLNQQNVVTLYDAFSLTKAPSQPQADAITANGSGSVITGGTGACVGPVSYWDIGVRGDTSLTGGSGFRLAPRYSVITDVTDYPNLNNIGSNPTLLSQYCNGSRVPPEIGSMGYLVNPGTNENNAPNPIFNLTPSATVDEGNNWINMRWGPLALTHPVTGAILGNYGLASGSPAINFIPTNEALPIATPASLASDFYGNPRPSGTGIDAGAVEFVQSGPAASVAPTTLAFGSVSRASSSTLPVTLTNLSGGILTNIALNFSNAVFTRSGGTCGATLAAGANCTINVTFKPTIVGAVRGTLTITLTNGANPGVVTGSPVTLTGTGF